MEDFLGIPRSSWVGENALAFAIEDRFPVSPGHTLVIPKRKVATWFEASREEQAAILDLVDEIRRRLDAERRPAGYNVGFNAGAAAGQTVFHLHVHVIPRYEGDMHDPRGGVRHVIPGKGNYLQRAASLATGGDGDPFLRHLMPLAERADEVAVVAAFVLERGVPLIQRLLAPALRRGARVRLVTGDYMNCTQPSALHAVLDWIDEIEARLGEAREGGEPDEAAPVVRPTGRLEARVIEVARLPGKARAFHPKSWRFEGPGLAAAFVGSSNVSHSALLTGVEWNLRVDRDWDSVAYQQVAAAFEDTWALALPLTEEWIAAYAERVKARPPAVIFAETAEAESGERPEPHEIQQAVLRALAEARAAGRRRALVVMATGLGKTLVAAFDVAAFREERGVRPRVLFLAHREELLRQAHATFRRVLPEEDPPLRFSFYAGERSDLTGDVVLASVMKLTRPEGIARLAERPFDYVVVDEVHHAEAPSYRRILGRLEPGFLLGLTATPDRADAGDVLGLFDDFLAYRADLGVGIEHRLLVPFAYHGLKDDVDYSSQKIPWSNGKFEMKALVQAVSTSPRMERLWTAWQAHRGTRTLVFCCTIEHAAFARDWLKERGVRAEAVHSGEGSYDRALALRQLADGELDAVCTVDLFNEGVDVPRVDRVVMLRPTESPVVFLQQLGRGLRTARGKERLEVIDFVGNHRMFAVRLRTLLQAAAARPVSLQELMEADGPLELRPECLVDVELEAKALLDRFLPKGRGEVERVYEELRDLRERRPTPSELYYMGQNPATLREQHGGWFEFVAKKGDLSEAEAQVLAAARPWFAEFETTQMTKCFKMVVLEVLLDAGALREGMALDELAARSHEMLLRSPELLGDIEGVKELGPDPRSPDKERWLAYWRKNPIEAWAGDGKKDEGRRRWFRVEDERFVPQLPIPEGTGEAFADMTRELVEYRLARYRERKKDQKPGDAFECKVTWNQRDPILKLPSRKAREDLPGAGTPVRMPNGGVWTFDFMKEYCNVARPAGQAKNQLGDLLRGWFGPAAGQPGTAYQVRFAPGPDGWSVMPVRARMVSSAPLRAMRYYPTLRAAAGPPEGSEGELPAEEVRLPVDKAGPGIFAVRATGDSMDGGKNPVRDGDWLVMKLLDGADLGAIEGQVALVEVPGAGLDLAYQIKRVVQRDGCWWLASDNAARESYEATPRVRPVAALVQVLRPEELAPEVGDLLTDEAVREAFQLSQPVQTGRIDGHLFLCIGGKGIFTEPDRIKLRIADRRPGESAFVLVRSGGEKQWRYRGVARWEKDDNSWSCQELDYATWRAVSDGRSCSRRLPLEAIEKAQKLTEHLLSTPGLGGWIERNGKKCRLVDQAPTGGLRIDGGAEGFAERTVSLVDIAWALVATDDVSVNGGMLDESRVNRLRYLEGTPKGSTRWIDTGWSLVFAMPQKKK